MKIIVTGGAGFIGSNIVDRYVSVGHEVLILDNLSSGHFNYINKKSKFVHVDIRDSYKLDLIIQDFKPDIINHHAAQMDVRVSLTDPIFDAETNIIGTLNIILAATKYGVKKIIYSSTGGAVHGEPKVLPVNEEDDVVPDCAYGISKHTPEHYLKLYAKLEGLDYTVFRYPNVYGPRQSNETAGVISIFIRQMQAKEPVNLYGYGNPIRDYVFISDICDANDIALTKGSNSIINLGSNKGTSVKELFTLISKHMIYDQYPNLLPLRKGEINSIFLSNDKAKQLLDWSPTIDIEEGIKMTIEWHLFQSILESYTNK